MQGTNVLLLCTLDTSGKIMFEWLHSDTPPYFSGYVKTFNPILGLFCCSHFTLNIRA